MVKQTTFDIGIRKIKDLAFSVNEDVELNKEYGIQVNSAVHFDMTDKTIEFVLNIQFLTKEGNVEFMSSKTSNTFFIPDLAKYTNENNPEIFNLPDAMLITIVSLSVTHARALISRNAKGTKFEDIYLPIVNPADLTKNLFSRKTK